MGRVTARQLRLTKTVDDFPPGAGGRRGVGRERRAAQHGAGLRRNRPHRFDHQVQADAGDFDVEARRQRLARWYLQAQTAVADVDDRRGDSCGRDAETAEDPRARPAAFTPNGTERAVDGVEQRAGLHRLAHELRAVSAGLELHQRLVIARHDDDGRLRRFLANLLDEVQPVVAAQAHVGDEEVVAAQGEELLGILVRGRGRHVEAALREQLDDARQGVLVVLENEDAVG